MTILTIFEDCLESKLIFPTDNDKQTMLITCHATHTEQTNQRAKMDKCQVPMVR